MEIINNQMQLVLYGNIECLSRTSSIPEIFDVLRDKKYIPSSINQLRIDGGIPAQVNRPRFLSQDNALDIKLLGDRIDLLYKHKPDSDSNDVNSFTSECLYIIAKLAGIKPFGFNRMGIVVTTSILDDTTSLSDNIYMKCIMPPEFYVRNVPFKWSQRYVSRVSMDFVNRVEEVNVNTLIKKDELTSTNDEGKEDKKPTLEITYDINTVTKNTDERFVTDELGTFLTKATEFLEQVKLSLLNLVDIE